MRPSCHKGLRWFLLYFRPYLINACIEYWQLAMSLNFVFKTIRLVLGDAWRICVAFSFKWQQRKSIQFEILSMVNALVYRYPNIRPSSASFHFVHAFADVLVHNAMHNRIRTTHTLTHTHTYIRIERARTPLWMRSESHFSAGRFEQSLFSTPLNRAVLHDSTASAHYSPYFFFSCRPAPHFSIVSMKFDVRICLPTYALFPVYVKQFPNTFSCDPLLFFFLFIILLEKNPPSTNQFRSNAFDLLQFGYFFCRFDVCATIVIGGSSTVLSVASKCTIKWKCSNVVRIDKIWPEHVFFTFKYALSVAI